jgi:hypothetical protein
MSNEMTSGNDLRAAAAKYSWARLALMSAALLLATVCAGGSVFAADDCGAKPAHHVASTQCQERHPRAGVHSGSRTQKTVNTDTTATTDGVSGDDASDGDELTPVTATVSSSKAFASHHYAAPTTARARLPDEALPASTLVHRLGRAGNGASPWRAHRAPSGDQGPPSADMSVLARAVTNDGTSQDSAATLGHLVPGGGLPSVPAPAAWAILLMGVLGLIAIARQPGVARAQSWAMSSLSPSVTRSAAGIGAVDRVDPSRYAQAPARRSHQGHFVRAATPALFGVDA